MNTILASNSEHDSTGSEPESEWRRGPSAYDVLCRPPPWIFSKQYFDQLFISLTFFIILYIGFLWTHCQLLIIYVSSIIQYFYQLCQNRDKKKIRTRWCAYSYRATYSPVRWRSTCALPEALQTYEPTRSTYGEYRVNCILQ
jgi:hypothetical protein